ncbi:MULTISPECIES: SDR family NAD(P)-dependent oxidoreductase [Streptomyces]|uniref:SDR family NAD(P)-dependent oxidoreductase n=1 Tax=Streptomyces TaxID=1883 RepID=UPI002F915D9F|nr:SDR family NAD(P)-dependent oxidoreductase [Streptomyces chartreusis]WTA33490.1 SDR family NAD(P)-dependent oxidoreductase [Streptomyces chartreusis]
MTTTLVTGANKGIGREAAKRLIEAGHDVWISARDRRRGQEAAEELGGRFVQLDVTDSASVAAAAKTVWEAGTGLDVLVNNAAIFGSEAPIEEITGEDADEVFRTNVSGIIRVTNAFLPLLKQSPSPVIVNVSSTLGSVALTIDPERVEYTVPNVTYSPSKAAVDMLTTQYAKVLPGFRINVVDPGHTATEMNAFQGAQTLTEGTDAIFEMATIGSDGPTGQFINRQGPIPW